MPEHASIVVTDREGLGIAAVLARKNRSAALAQRLREHLGVEMPEGPRCSVAGNFTLARVGPDAWLAIREPGDHSFSRSLGEKIGDLASVTDHSDGYVVMRAAGPGVRETLSRLVPIDVHQSVFHVHDVAATVAAHIGVILWRLEDCTLGPTFELAIPRSVAASFRDALAESHGIPAPTLPADPRDVVHASLFSEENAAGGRR